MVAGGFESMSNAPHLIHMRRGMQFGDSKIIDSLSNDGLTGILGLCFMDI